MASVRQKLANAVRKGKAIDAERKQSVTESEAKAAQLVEAEQRIAALEQILRYAADSANSEEHGQLSAAQRALDVVTAERDAAQAAAEQAAAAQRAAAASAADVIQQLDQSRAAAAAQTEGTVRGAAAEAVAGQASTPEAGELRAEAVRLRQELQAAAERAATGVAAAAELERVRQCHGATCLQPASCNLGVALLESMDQGHSAPMARECLSCPVAAPCSLV